MITTSGNIPRFNISSVILFLFRPSLFWSYFYHIILKLLSLCYFKGFICFLFFNNSLTLYLFCLAVRSSCKPFEMFQTIKWEECLSCLSLHYFSFLITIQEFSKYFCLSLKPETCWYYYIVANVNTIRYLSKHFNLRHSKEIIKGSHSNT